jgi:hypothetical protein
VTELLKAPVTTSVFVVILNYLFPISNVNLFQMDKRDDISRGNIQVAGVPFHLRDRVIKGFGRGSKQLGIPTGASKNIRFHMTNNHSFIACTT